MARFTRIGFASTIAVVMTVFSIMASGCHVKVSQAGVIEVASALSCKTCAVMLDTIATLSTDFIGPSTALGHAPTGEIYVIDSYDRTIRVYSSAGRFTRRLGRRGAGPGEYEAPRNVLFGQDGSVHVIDAALFRHSVYSRAGDFLASHLAPVFGGIGRPAVLLHDMRLVVNSRPGSPTDHYHPVIVIDTIGSVKPLVDQTDTVLPRRPWHGERLLWALPNGGLLVANPYSFSIDVYDSTLTRIVSVIRRAEWIPTVVDPLLDPSDGMFDRPYTPDIREIWTDSENQVWVHMMVPLKSWKPGPPSGQASKLTQAELESLSQRPRVGSIVEVLDPTLRHVIARTRYDKPLGLFFGGGYLAASTLDDTGEPSVRISSVHLKP